MYQKLSELATELRQDGISMLYGLNCNSNGILLQLDNDLTSLVEYAKTYNIKHLFYQYYYLNQDEYLIDELKFKEQFEEEYKLLKNDIQKHNAEVQALNFENPSALLVYCINQGFSVNVRLEASWSNGLLTNKEYISDIKNLYVQELQNAKFEREEKILLLKENLKEYIMNDESFSTKTNKQLRYYYGRELLEMPKFKGYDKAFYQNSYFIGADFNNFIENLWIMKKEMQKKGN